MALKPTPIGPRIDALYKHRQKRLDLQREVDELKEAERTMESAIFEELSRAKLPSASGSLATFSWRPEPTVRIDDPEAFRQYMTKRKAWELCSMRPATTAFKDRWSEDPDFCPDGIIKESAIKISLTKAGKRKTG